MVVHFIEQRAPLTGLAIQSVELDTIPNMGDKVRIGSKLYIVKDKMFNVNVNTQINVDIFLDYITSKQGDTTQESINEYAW